MYLNDFCDAEFDARYCPERPIPAGKISRTTVGWLAALWFVLGLASLAVFGVATAAVASLLVGVIVIYDFWHKNVACAPLLMGLCRVLLYLMATAASDGLGIFRHAFLWWPVYLFALTLGAYVSGITIFARGESRPEKPARWAAALLFLPIFVQVVLGLYYPSPIPLSTYLAMPAYYIPKSAFFYCVLFFGWLAWLLVPYWRKTKPSMRRLVSGLLAAIVLVDMIALSQVPGTLAPLLLPFFLLALLLQRIIPAT
jgi:4-hydroxybenzoate polyprenyltransferase